MRISYSGCELSTAAVALEISLRTLAALGQPTLSDIFLATVRLYSAGGQASKAVGTERFQLKNCALFWPAYL